MGQDSRFHVVELEYLPSVQHHCHSQINDEIMVNLEIGRTLAEMWYLLTR